MFVSSKSSNSWLLFLTSYLLTVQSAPTSTNCRCMPQDDCWPTELDWAQFNGSLGGKLIATIPLASPCHAPNYDAGECQYLRSQWTNPEIHDGSSSSIMAAAVANETCYPFTPVSQACVLGSLVVYAVNASEPADFAKTIQFAKDKNIRLVIRNTGHDYLGKSTGAGALSIWTHNMKNVEFTNFTSPFYNGPAVKLAAGIQDEEAYSAVDKKGMAMVGGDCGTVGPVGGYTQGGGHSALSSSFGLGADQALEWEVVDGNGQFLRASPTENSDLYWAMSGGGGGTYAVASSLTVKIRPSFSVTGVVLNFTAANNVSLDSFYEAIGYYHQFLPTITAAGGTAIAEISNTSFVLTPVTFPKTTMAEANALMKPFTNRLEQLSIPYSYNATTFPTFLQHYNTLIEPNPTQLVENGQYGGRFIPLDVIENNNEQLTAAVRQITQDGVAFVSIGLNVSSEHTGYTNNSVHPSWRTAAMNVILTSSWPNGANLSHMQTLAQRMTEKWVPALTALAPESGCYMSEADPHQPDWKTAFYGPNYNALYQIKKKYDPEDVFYAPTAVGSDNWELETDGSLCYVGNG